MKMINKIILAVILLLVISGTSGYLMKKSVKSTIKDLFTLNESLQDQGYYMAEFEFKMMGMAYYIDRGHYFKALSKLFGYHKQLKNKENLIRVPEFKNKEDEFEFYLSLQNPRTGAFMDDSYPYCTFNEPTENVITHLDLLSKETGQPLKLKYPLRYLDEINTPEKLYGFLDDVTHVGPKGMSFPQTTYVFGRSLLSYHTDESVISRNNLYSFSPEYKQALLKWFYDDQDSITGFWGPRSRKSGTLLKPDLTNTASVIKAFVYNRGSNIYSDYPLRYGDKMVGTTIEGLKGPVPGDDDPDELHEWNLAMSKGIYLLLRYLWNYASDEEKLKAKSIIEDYVRIKFEKYYIPAEGAFSYYPNAKHASLDGTGGSFLKEIGAFSPSRQKRLWGDPVENIKDLGKLRLAEIKKEELDIIAKDQAINSLRIYSVSPAYDNLTDNVYAVVYPGKTCVPDIMELVPKINRWLDAQTSSMGNWTSREEIRNEYASLKIKEPVIFKETSPAGSLNNIFLKNRELYIIGFDVLQIPRYKISYLLK